MDTIMHVSHLKKKYQDCEIVLVGMNYSLYERLAQKHGFLITELNSSVQKSRLPKINDFKNILGGKM